MLLNMAVKIALAVGLFIVICVLPGIKSSQVVPDGLVYTEVKKTLVRGVQGVLTCRFHGDPLAVYWKKGLDPDDLSTMVSWLNGEVSGPRYEDESCDVDIKYSLIINNVSTAHAGRIYCTVVNYKGNLIKNYTDILVVDTAITTNQQVTLPMRQATYGLLQCTVHIKAKRVSWKKGTTSTANESLVVIENNHGVAERSGAGYYDGTYNITEDYSLVITELQIHHEGLYVCEVADDTGISFQNYTFVKVVSQPLEPFPTIQECLNAEHRDSNYCILVANSGMTLTCQAVKYYPSINLVFLYGSRVLVQSDTREWDNKDRTKNKTITIATRGNKELYTCVASSIPGTNTNKSTSVLLQGNEPVKSTMVVILVCFAFMILISSGVYFLWRKKQQIEDFQALEQRINEVLMQHYGRTSDCIDKKCTMKANDITDIRTSLFDTHQMLIDWRQRSSRNQETVDIETEPAYAWPSDKELKTISRHLKQESMKEVCKKLTIDCQYDDANDEGERFETLCKWRTKASDKPLEETWKQFSSVLESNHLRGLLPTLRGPYIYKAELVDLAFHLLMHDLFPVAKVLGINVPKLVSYRPTFHPSHLEIGTIELLTELSEYIEGSPLLMVGEDYKRSVFCRKIANLHHINMAIAGMFEYNMSYGELYSISEAMHQSARRRADQTTSAMLPGPEIDLPKELQDVLRLTDQDIAEHPNTPYPITAYALVKIWKEKPRPSVFNYRAVLAQEIRRIDMTGLADEIIAGKFITVQTSLAFIEDMVRGLNQDQIRSLGELLQLTLGENEQGHTSTPFNDITMQIYDWVAGWSTGIEGSWRNTLLQVTPETKETARKHRDLNDKLVEHGFLDLAREVMIIEQQQFDRKTVVEYVMDKDVNHTDFIYESE